MAVTVNPSSINGTINAPASKSSMQRACALALLHHGITTINNPGKSNDDLAALNIIQKLGAKVEIEHDALKITSEEPTPIANEINCGESGLGIRMFAPIAALSSQQIIINGEGSLLNRPMHFFDEQFPQLGVAIESSNGYLPIKIKGPLRPADIVTDGSVSSQFLTGLLMAYGKSVIKPVTITVTNLKSKPYIDLTLQMMKQFGYDVLNNNYESFTIRPINKLSNKQINCTVEGDWSGAAFLLVAGAVAGNIVVEGLNINSAQADKEILTALKDCGASVSINDNKISVHTFSNEGRPFKFDATDCPDLFPPLVALAAYCNGISTIKGVSRLQHKESNRSLSLQQEFGKMGLEIKVEADLMIIKGKGILNAAKVHSHHDHRIAMACAVAALKANGETVIENADAINKSYPGFYEDLKMLGGNVSLPINK